MVTMHPGEYFALSYVEPYQIEPAEIAACLGMPQELVMAFLARRAGVTAELALRLSLAFGRSAESWLSMQSKFDLSQVRENIDVSTVRPFSFPRKDAA